MLVPPELNSPGCYRHGYLNILSVGPSFYLHDIKLARQSTCFMDQLIPSGEKD